MDATFAEKHVMPLCHIEVYLSLFFLQDQIYLENQLSESWQITSEKLRTFRKRLLEKRPVF